MPAGEQEPEVLARWEQRKVPNALKNQHSALDDIPATFTPLMRA